MKQKYSPDIWYGFRLGMYVGAAIMALAAVAVIFLVGGKG